MSKFMDWLRVIGNAFQYVKNAPFTGRDSKKSEVENLSNFINKDKSSNIEQASQILGEVQNSARQEYLEDRAHTEAREDSAYQRAVADMRSAGLNPYTIGASGTAPSSSSNVGQLSVMSKLQVLGYVLDLENLNIKNKQVINQAIGNIIRAVK